MSETLTETLTEPLTEPPPTKTDGVTADHLNEHTLTSSGGSSKAAAPPPDPQAPEDQWNARLASGLDPVSFLTTGTQEQGGAYTATAMKGRDAEKSDAMRQTDNEADLLEQPHRSSRWPKTRRELWFRRRRAKRPKAPISPHRLPDSG